MDFELARFCNRLGAGVIDPATELLCHVGFLAAFWVLLFAVAFARDRARRRHIALAAALALLAHFFFNEAVLKHALLTLVPMRTRPYLAHPGDIACVGYPFADSSFPSSHAASTAALVTVLGYYFRWSTPFGAALALAMAFSRVHNGMHYPSDVLSGTLLGVGYGALALASVKRLAQRWASLAPSPSPSSDERARGDEQRGLS